MGRVGPASSAEAPRAPVAIPAVRRVARRSGVLARGRGVLTLAHHHPVRLARGRAPVRERGEVVEQGPPEELVWRGGRSAAPVELEAAGWDWRVGTGGDQ